LVEEVMDLFGHHCRMEMVGRLAVLQAKFVMSKILLLERSASSGDLRYPGFAFLGSERIGQRFEEVLFVADDPEVERPVAAEVFLNGIDADGLDIRRQTI